MAETPFQPRPPAPRTGWRAGTNVSSTPPHSTIARVVSDPTHQTFVTGLHHGSASATSPDSTLPSDTFLTGIQDNFQDMPTDLRPAPKDYPPPPNDPFPDLADLDPYSYEPLPDAPSYHPAPSSPSVNPGCVDSSFSENQGATSHQVRPEPWSHLAKLTEPSPCLPDITLNQYSSGVTSLHLRTPTSAPQVPAGGPKTFADSAYASGSRKSPRPSELESPEDLDSDTMDYQHLGPSRTPHLAAQSSSHDSTITPTTLHNTQQPDAEGKISSRQIQKRHSGLICQDCKYQAKTRSDLK
jgi:hypothetical protein